MNMQSFLSLQKVDYQASVLDLDQNHTHFILVDSGASGDNNAEIKHRATLVKHISNLKIDIDEPTSINVPSVTVILDEGAGSIKHLKTAIDASISSCYTSCKLILILILDHVATCLLLMPYPTPQYGIHLDERFVSSANNRDNNGVNHRSKFKFNL